MNVVVISDSDRRIERCIAHMLGRLNGQVSVPELARVAGLSPAHFTALFKEKTGCPPIHFFIRLRMHQAGYLLKFNNISVREIAATLGYKDPFFFSRQFKLIHGVAPKNYRMKALDIVPPIPEVPASMTALQP